MKRLFAILFSTILYSSTTIACTKPTAPVLPDVSTAVTAQMVKAKNEVKAFMSNANAYLECVADAVEHNQMVDEMQQVANEFNDIVRKYKARLAKG